MKNHHFLMDALEQLDDDLIEEAKDIRPKRHWKPWIAAAAALAILISTVAVFLPDEPSGDSIVPYADTYIRNFITQPASLYEQGYVGNPYNETESSSITTSALSPYRLKLTVKAVEILPDTYRTVGQQSGGFRLVRMEFIHALNTEYSGQYFYYTMSEADTADLTKYDTLVLEQAQQYGHSGHVIYNVTLECLTAIDLPLIGGGCVYAFTDDVFDPSLGNTGEKMKLHAENSSYSNYPISETPTLSEFEEYLCRGNVGRLSETIYVQIEPVNQDLADAQEYVRPFENGIFVPSINSTSQNYRNDVLLYRRYAGGYPTNEAVQISPEGVTYFGAKFTEEDLKELPDLAKALETVTQNFDAGLITPGHIQNWEEMKFITHSIFGWYHKTDTGVYGVIRVSWCYHGYREDGDFDVFHDDQYFLVELNSDTLRPIERNELAAMGGSDSHFMLGQYGYDEYGRKNNYIFAYY